jgi:hypothetical protein
MTFNTEDAMLNAFQPPATQPDREDLNDLEGAEGEEEEQEEEDGEVPAP